MRFRLPGIPRFSAFLLVSVCLLGGLAVCQRIPVHIPTPLPTPRPMPTIPPELWKPTPDLHSVVESSYGAGSSAEPPDDRAQTPLYRLTSPFMSGNTVRAIQRALDNAGCDPGPLDGQFGPQTEAAVIRFQHSHELSTDGIVGPRTARALGVQ
jgi:hypothetical protein